MEKLFVYTTWAMELITFVILIGCCMSQLETVNASRQRDALFHICCATIIFISSTTYIISAFKMSDNRCDILDTKTNIRTDSMEACNAYFNWSGKILAGFMGVAFSLILVGAACIIDNHKLFGMTTHEHILPTTTGTHDHLPSMTASVHGTDSVHKISSNPTISGRRMTPVTPRNSHMPPTHHVASKSSAIVKPPPHDKTFTSFGKLPQGAAASLAQTTPTVTPPTVAAPTVAAPTVAAPNAAASTAATPTVGAPHAAATTVAAPTVAAPTLTAPTAALGVPRTSRTNRKS
ncbi:unnamed protein product [Orchesella dallaii]|uniref:Uncharacterized protein n=1 Tax=Orchesella dallaii TaxID=48710 RepID=A0ABP1R9H9_9HEXA